MSKHCLFNEKGAALVEMALTAPLLLGMIIGAAELGRIAYAAIEVQNAARAAVAYGSQSLIDSVDTTGMGNAATNEAPNLTLTTTITDSCVCETIASDGTITNTAVTCSSATTSGNCAVTTIPPVGTVYQVVTYVQAQTTATVATMFNYNYHGIGFPSSFTLHGYAKMRKITD